jgi:hypothetical protein
MWTGGRGISPDGTWRWEINRAVRRYNGVHTVDQYLDAVTSLTEESAQQAAQAFSYTAQTASSEEKESLDEKSGMGELPYLSPQIPLLGSGIDEELWEYVRPLAENGRWEQVAREAAAFVETRSRDWTSSRREILDLMSELLAPAKSQGAPDKEIATLRNEQEGWHLFARGFFMAVRNHVMHNTVGIEEQLQYGLGALGAASLLVRRIRVVVQASAVDATRAGRPEGCGPRGEC